MISPKQENLILNKKEQQYFNMIDGDRGFLIKLHSLIFINSNSLTNPQTATRTRSHFRGNFYFLYNSVYFTSYSRKLNKFKLAEFFSSKLIDNVENRDVSVMYNSKKKIGFGKLTWYWIFKMMSNNRFLLNFKQYRNSLSVVKFSFYEMALKSYEKNYNNWLFFTNKATEDLNLIMVKQNNRKVFRHYSKSNYRSVLTNNTLRHKPLTEEFKKTRLSLESNKVYRRMPIFSQPSVKRFRRFLKKKRRVIFRKNFLFAKYWRAPLIRIFKKKATKVEKSAEVSFRKWRPFIFKKNIRILGSVKYWEKKMKKSLWNLRRTRSDYFGSASLSFTRSNLLTDSVLSSVKPSLLRDFRSKNKKMHHSVNFKYKLPINSVESQLGYDYFSTFSIAKYEMRNSFLFSHESKGIGNSQGVRRVTKKRTLVAAPSNGSETMPVVSYFKFNKILKKKTTAVIKNNKSTDFFVSAKNIKFGKVKALLTKNISFSDKFSFSNNYKANKLSAQSFNKKKTKTYLKKNINNLFSRLTLLFFYKAKPVLSKFLFKNTTRYFNFRYLLNKSRLDHLITNVFLNSTLSYHALELVDVVAKNRMAMVKQSLLLKLFSKMRVADIENTVKENKKTLKRRKSNLSKWNNSILMSKLSINNKNLAVRKIKNFLFYNNVSLVGGNVIVKNKKIKRINFLKKYRKLLKIKRKVIRFDSRSFKEDVDSSQFFKKKNFMEFKKKTFKRRSLLRNLFNARSQKSKFQAKKISGGRSQSFQKLLGLAPLPWNKMLDSSGRIVTKYNRRQTLWFIRKNTKPYAKFYSYKKLTTYNFFGNQSIAFSEIGSRFSNKNLTMLKWYSSVISDRRLPILETKKKLLVSKSFLNALCGSKTAPIFFKKQYLPVHKKMKKMYGKFSKNQISGLVYINRKKELRDSKIRKFLRKRKFLYKVKPRLKSRKQALLRSLALVRFFKRRKYMDWWFSAFRKRFNGSILKRAASRRISKRKKFRLKKFFIMKSKQVLILNLMFNLKLNSYPRKVPSPLKKFRYLVGNSIVRQNELSSFSKVKFNRLKRRDYWSKRFILRKFINKRRVKILKRKWKKRKTRLSLFVYKTKNFKKKFKKRRAVRSIWSFKKKSKYMYSYVWDRAGLSENFLKKKIKIRFFKPFVVKKTTNFSKSEIQNYYINRFTNYKVRKFWNFEKNNESFQSAHSFKNGKSVSDYTNRLYNFSKLKKGFLIRIGKRLLFRRRSLKLKTPLNYKAFKFLVKVNNTNFVSNNCTALPNKGLSVSEVPSFLLKFSKFKNVKNSNIYDFFKKMGISSNFSSKSFDLKKKYSNSSKFFLQENSTNYFNLESLNSFIVKNLKIYDLVDYSHIFNKANLVWKSNSLRNFEKKFSIKRKVNRRYFSLFFFYDFKETNLYRLYALNYKKTLRKVGRPNGNRVLERKIRFGVSMWRMQYMSSNLKTKYSVDSEKFKYDFTKHLAINRKFSNYLKINLKGLRDSLRTTIKFLVKKNLGWVSVDKKFFKRGAGWSWKRRYKLIKKPFLALKKKVWSKVKSNYKFKTIDKYESFVGKRLIRRLKKRLFKKKKLFWTQKRFLIDNSKWGNFGYFWSTISDDYHKFNLEFRKKKFKFPWFKIKPKTYFKKVRAFAWKAKNPLYWRKHGQYAKRFYPRFWYKVFRRKFPLKRHRKDWALKLGKMFSMWPYSEKKYTFYDSSAVHFKNLSINVRPKRHKKIFHYMRKFEMQYVDRDLEIFDFEMDPKFSRKLTRKSKGSYFYSWRANSMYRNFTKNIPLSVALMFAPTTTARKMSAIDIKNIDISDRKIFNIFTKRTSRLLSNLFSTYNLYLSIVKKKINSHFFKRKFPTSSLSLLETKAHTDSVNDSNVMYFTDNSSKYSVIKKNMIHNKAISKDSLMYSFGFEVSSDFKDLNYKYNFVTPNNQILYKFNFLGTYSYWNNILYSYTSKYRYPHFETAHSVTQLDNKANLTPITAMDSKLLNKNMKKLESLAKLEYKKLDFLKKNFSGQYQFTSKVSNFYKKNMWIFNSFDTSSSNYSLASVI